MTAVLVEQGHRPRQCCRILVVAPDGYFGWRGGPGLASPPEGQYHLDQFKGVRSYVLDTRTQNRGLRALALSTRSVGTTPRRNSSDCTRRTAPEGGCGHETHYRIGRAVRLFRADTGLRSSRIAGLAPAERHGQWERPCVPPMD